jgi:hypothetical protein
MFLAGLRKPEQAGEGVAQPPENKGFLVTAARPPNMAELLLRRD